MRIVVAGRGQLAVRGAQLFALLVGATAPEARIECLPGEDDRGIGEESLSLRRVAVSNGWTCHVTVSDCALGPSDLLVSLQHPHVIRIADLGGARAVNLHFSCLPRHRGSLSCYWPIAERDNEVGVTLHEMTDAVDAGPIIAARRFALPEFMTAGELFGLFHRHAYDLLAAHADTLLSGCYRTREQVGTRQRAHRRRDVDFSRLDITDFARPSLAVRDACLALVFPGRQLPTFDGRSVQDCSVVSTRTVHGEVGEVVARTAGTALVRCADGFVCLEFATEQDTRAADGAGRPRHVPPHT